MPYDSGDGDLEPAVAYLRKSTKGERKGRDGKARQKQEKSLQQQKEEVLKKARGRHRIVKWYEDEGVSGWKRGAKRPDYTAMLAEAKALGAKAIYCDQLDRFSRSTVADVQADVTALCEAGVAEVITCDHGEYDLRAWRRNDLGGILRFVTTVWAAHEFSRTVGRRVALARRNKAEEGKRTGGPTPYGLVDDGTGGLKHGDPEEVAIVRWVFDQFVNHLRSLRWIALALNERGTRPPQGQRWYPATLARILRQPAYRGDFAYNRERRGHFFGVDAEGEVVEAAELQGAGKVYTSAGVYDPVVDPDLFDRAQRRLAALSRDPGRRKRHHALSGVLICDNCGTPLSGVQDKHRDGTPRPVIYRCNASVVGRRCHQGRVQERDILPFLTRVMTEELDSLQALVPAPPDNLRQPQKERAERREQAARERDKLAARIARAEETILDTEDKRTRQSLDKKLSEMRDELDRLNAALATEPEGDGPSPDDLKALAAWWNEFGKTAVQVPWPCYFEDPDNPDRMLQLGVSVDPRKLNEALLELGTEVRLRWETKTVLTPAGRPRRQHVLRRGRFRLGQSQGDVGEVICRAARRP